LVCFRVYCVCYYPKLFHLYLLGDILVGCVVVVLMSTINRRASKRRRRRPPQEFHAPTASEERFLHQAIQNSKLDRSRDGEISIPWGPTFYPSVEEMGGSPLDYIEKIRPIAQCYGICKIVPPKGWNPAYCKCSLPCLSFSGFHIHIIWRSASSVL
jgi:hypothetical protein